MRIALIGAPGSGKGTQAKLLAARYRVPHISSGELLRQAAKSDKSFNKQAEEAMEQGHLVRDDLIRELLAERLRHRDTKRGFVIDGYPRNIPQAQSLDNLLGMLGRALQISIYTEVDDATLTKRIKGRLVCGKCGAIFNKTYSPPAVSGICDHCGGKLEVRKDNTTKAIANQVEAHRESIKPLITYYRAQHKLRTVSAVDSVDEIHDKICAMVDLEIRPLEIDALVTAADSMDEEESTIIAGGQINKIPPSPEPAVKKPVVKKVMPEAKVSTASAKGAKKTGKKTIASTAKSRKAPVSKVSTKKVTTKKAAKVTGGKATTAEPTAQSVAKKAAAKPQTTKKTAKKTTAKKSTAKKAQAKKSLEKTASKKKTAGQKAPTKKTPVKKAAKKKR